MKSVALSMQKKMTDGTEAKGGARMKLTRVLVILGVLGLAAGMLPQESAAHSPIVFGINIGMPAPVAVYPAQGYHPPAYVYGPPPVYGPQVIVPLGPRYRYYAPPYYGRSYGHYKHRHRGYHD